LIGQDSTTAVSRSIFLSLLDVSCLFYVAL